MVRILVCPSCREEVERTSHLDLYSTYRSIIFGCRHSIENLKREVEEQMFLTQARGEKSRAVVAPKIIKHSRIEYRDGRFLIKGDKLPLEKKISGDLAKS